MKTAIGKPSASPAKPSAASVVTEAPKPPTVAGKTIKALTTFTRGSVFVVNLLDTNDVNYYIKNKQGVVEIGGTIDFDTGVKVPQNA